MILVFTETANGKLKKTSFEVAAYGAKLGDCTAIVLGSADNSELTKLGNYGIKKVLHVSDNRLDALYSKAYTKAICAAANQTGAEIIVMAHTSTGKTVAPRVAIRMQAALLPGVMALPETSGNIRKTVFSGKAFAELQSAAGKKVITVNQNSYKAEPSSDTAVVEPLAVDFNDADFDYKILATEDESGGHIPLPDAEIVVSGGRGLKGPENWGIVEDLANALGAATACSRPVADIGWRPHHEHVGQTGITIKPTLYIAIGISGAIQHLAGVNQSKVIVVINKDPEAPFFKDADYGIIGDAFEVLPKITEAVKKLKAS
jgi:electron transfer flavoprotein alpha subunit